jgi:hypothetical protein
MSTAISESRIFRLSPLSLPAAEARLRRKSTPIYLVLIAGCSIPLFLQNRAGEDLTALFVTVTFVALLLAFVMLRGVRKGRACVRKLWETFELEVDATHITRRNADTPTATIAFADVTEIIQYPGRGMLLKTSRALQTVEVPEGIDDYQAAVDWVRQRCTVPVTNRPERAWNSPVFAMVLGLAGWVLFLNIEAKPWVFILGAALVGLCGWAIWAVKRSPNVSRATSRTLVYVFIIVICLARMGYLAGMFK